MTNSKHSLSAQKQYYVSVSPKFPYEQTPLSACGRIEKTCKIARHGYVDCVRASGLPVFDTDMLVDALRGFSAGLDYVEEAEQQGALRISITTEMELIVGCRNRREQPRIRRDYEYYSNDRDDCFDQYRGLRPPGLFGQPRYRSVVPAQRVRRVDDRRCARALNAGCQYVECHHHQGHSRRRQPASRRADAPSWRTRLRGDSAAGHRLPPGDGGGSTA